MVGYTGELRRRSASAYNMDVYDLSQSGPSRQRCDLTGQRGAVGSGPTPGRRLLSGDPALRQRRCSGGEYWS